MTEIQPDLVAALRAAALGPASGSDETDLVRRISRRTRMVRRRRITGGVAGLAVIVAAGVVALPGHRVGADRPAVLEPATPAATTAQSFSPTAGPSDADEPPVQPATVGLGAVTRLPTTLTRPLLVVDTQGLALLSGGTRTELTGTRGASSPGISHDGRWVSWLTVDGDSSILHVARSTGGAVADTSDVTSAAWSPTDDVIAVAEQSSVVVFAPDRPVRVSVPEKFAYQVVWNPKGGQLAYSGSVHDGELLVSATATGVSAGDPVLLPSADDSEYIAGFFGAGLLLWPDPSHSASIAADGLPLSFYDPIKGTTTPLTTTLTYPDWVLRLPAYYANSASQAAVLIVTGGDRIAEDNKHPAVWLLPTQAGGPLQRASTTPGRLPEQPSLVSIAVDPLGAIATVNTKQESNYGASYALGTLDEQSLYGYSTPVEAAGHSVVAVGSSADGFLVVQPQSLQLLTSGGQLLSLGELGTGPERNAGYYGHLAVSSLVAAATG